jgi:hypothetical protein
MVRISLLVWDGRPCCFVIGQCPFFDPQYAQYHSAHFVTESDHHFLNMDCTLVGRTAKARKGISWKHIRNLFAQVDEEWAAEHIQSGLSSGEGLIHAVRDPVIKGDEIKDEGVTDKRLLVQEAEFASVLQMIKREGNTLSAILRNAWDSLTLQFLTKKSPETATDPHISVVGHITVEELQRHLCETEKANGFGNRFLWLVVKRVRLLPEGSKVPAHELKDLVRDLSFAVAFANKVGEMKRSEAARKLWHEVYGRLSEGSAGLFGALTSRAEAQVVRLSCIYALLDRSEVVDSHHLLAALAVWRYCEDSARYIFGDALGDPLADQILEELRRVAPDGLSRTEISRRLGHHKNADEIGRALSSLADRGLARAVEEQTDGRPVQRWFVSDPPNRRRTNEPVNPNSFSSHISPHGEKHPDRSSPDTPAPGGEKPNNISLNSPISQTRAEFHPENGDF